LSYPDDDEMWGADVCYDALLDDVPELADDAAFQERFSELFDEPLNWDEAHEAFDELEQYLMDQYDLDLENYFEWDDWRAEHDS